MTSFYGYVQVVRGWNHGMEDRHCYVFRMLGSRQEYRFWKDRSDPERVRYYIPKDWTLRVGVV